MKLINLRLEHIDTLLKLEEEMYWRGGKWSDLWQEEAKEKFKSFIEDYLTNFPDGCFGLVDDNEQLLGAMFLIKVSRLGPLPYFHKVSDCLQKDGEIAYVSCFVVRKGKGEEEIAQELYDEAEKIALFKLSCKTIAAVIYSSPLEERVLVAHNYEKLDEQFEWEIYPDNKVSCWIYYYELLMKQEG